MAKKVFQNVTEQVREATAIEEDVNLAPAEEKKTRKKKKDGDAGMHHLNISITEEQNAYLKAFAKLRGETQAETIRALIERSMRDNGDLAALVDKMRKSLI